MRLIFIPALFLGMILLEACEQISAVSTSEEAVSRSPSESAAVAASRGYREHVKATMRPGAQVLVASLANRLQDDFLIYSSTTGPSQVISTSQGDLLEGTTCRSFVDSVEPDYEGAVRCFVAAQEALFLDADLSERGPPPDLEVVRNEPGGLNLGDEQYLQFEQRHRGVRVERRSLTFVFSHRRLSSAAGRFAGTARFTQPPVDRPSLLRSAQLVVGSDAEEAGLLYNAESGELEFIVKGADNIEHRFDVATGELRSSERGGHPLQVPKNHLVYNYPGGLPPDDVFLGVGKNPTSQSGLSRCDNYSGTCNVAQSGVCTYHPHSQSYYRDRVSEVSTSYNGSQTFELVQYHDCASTSVFTSNPFNQTDTLAHYAASARMTIDQLELILNDSESFFWAYPRANTNLSLKVSGWPNAQAAGYYHPSSRELEAYQDPCTFLGCRQYARELFLLAHEYGHYVHHTYGLLSYPFTLRGKPQVIEGWGNHFALRVAVHKKFVANQWPMMAYETGVHNRQGFRVQSLLRMGEHVLDQLPEATQKEWLVYPNSWCTSSDYQDSYVCGTLMSMTYWVLAFDRCRVSYLDCDRFDPQIVRHNGGYLNSAWRLANSAYAYAIANVSGGADIAEFHTHVATRYAQFRAANYISAADEERVHSVLASHCLGPANGCVGLHKLPGSMWPSAHTSKDSLFREAESGERYGSASLIPAPNGASGNAFISMGATGELRLLFDIPQTGHYRVHFVVQPWASNMDDVRVFDPGTSAWKTMGPFTPNQFPWRWRKHEGTAPNCGGVVRFTTTGWRDLYLSTAQAGVSDLRLDAVWLEKVEVSCP